MNVLGKSDTVEIIFLQLLYASSYWYISRYNQLLTTGVCQLRLARVLTKPCPRSKGNFQNGTFISSYQIS